LNNYLEDVYWLYIKIRRRNESKKSKRIISKLRGLTVRKNVTLLRLLIDVTSGSQDTKQKSRTTQALRYAWKFRKKIEKGELSNFLKENGGIAGCATKMAALKKK